MASRNYPKPSKYITFASGWLRLTEDGEIRSISCKSDHKSNSRNNDHQGYKVFVVPVDGDGEQVGDPVAVDSFAVVPSGADKEKYESAPDFRVFFGVE